MSRQNHLFQNTFNKLLRHLDSNVAVGQRLPTDSNLTELLDVSRSTVRKAVQHLATLEIINDQRQLVRPPASDDYFDSNDDTLSKEELVERHFMRMINSGDIMPGDRFSELELARQSGCNTVTVREFLIKFSRFGLIEKSPRAQWQMKKFDESFADQLYEVRQIFEMHALANLMALPESHPAWKKLEQLLEAHHQLKAELPERYEAFSELDRQLHTTLLDAAPNQFISQFYDVISFVFHYHYQWDKSDELERNSQAVDEHIALISSILMRDLSGATLNLKRHLNTAKRTLKNSTFYRANAD